MKLVGLMPVRNEAWILGLSARVALQWCDSLVILNHASTDNTVELIADMQAERPDGVHLISTPELQWNEMEHRQMMLQMARSLRATHIALVDADEVLTGNLLNALPTGHCCIGGIIETLPPGHILQLPGYNLRGGIEKYHSSGVWGNRWFSTAFTDDPALSWSGDRFHSREPQGKPLGGYRPVHQGQGGVMHLWGASDRRLKAKHALYKITERLRWPSKPVDTIDSMYSWAIRGNYSATDTPDQWTYGHVRAEWWQPYNHLMQYLDIDAEPWQEAECGRLVKEHGARVFAGLDLFGVV